MDKQTENQEGQATIRIPDRLKDALQQEAEQRGDSLDGLIIQILGGWKPDSTPRKQGKRPAVAVDMTKDLELMDRDELKQYARAKSIRLYTVVPEKMRKQIREIEYTRAHHGDAFRDAEK